jgi:hypothetical protein
MKFKMGNSGIHIKPENKGKFTATKKATGKSTEELTHSKNPVTKKRAVFAQNAAKWKHADGSKNVKGFPDLNKDGKVSRADVLVGRGAIPAKKMQMGAASAAAAAQSAAKSKLPSNIGKSMKPEYTQKEIDRINSTKPNKVDTSKMPSIPSTYKPKTAPTIKKPTSSPSTQNRGTLVKNGSKSMKVDSKMCGSKGMKYAEGTKGIKFKKPMMKRADGSTSQRGLWDNIRANKGSGKKPTPEMLKQEKKIKAGK